MNREILIVDDDDLLAETLMEQFELDGTFQVTRADHVQKAMGILKEKNFDLIIMDVGLPDMDGRDFVRTLRGKGYKGPILMLTGHTNDADEILGLDAGANDYVLKPFRFTVLMARVRALLRMQQGIDDTHFVIGEYQFHPSAKWLLRKNGTKVKLTEKETAILKYLYRAEGKVVPRDQLLTEVWGYHAEASTHTLETHIYRLRQKIEQGDEKNTLLVTENGGYKLSL